MAKSTHEIHDKLEGHEGEKSARVAASYAAVLAQIMALDIVFSLDSVITAVGMVQQVAIMIAAVVVAVARHDGLREGRSATSSPATPRSRCWPSPSSS